MKPSDIESIDCTGVSIGNSDIEGSSSRGTLQITRTSEGHALSLPPRSYTLHGHEHEMGAWDDYDPLAYTRVNPFKENDHGK